ncbi:MAG: methyltransferase domain-containing protein [Thermoplasmata archaeon]|nr:methyltransferase domain-containing protein [Thermoplasmata archaeon]
MPARPSTKQHQQTTWAAGDLARVVHGSVLVGELLCEAVVLKAGETVLDVATGTGNTALAAARRRTQVVGVDFVPDLLAQARARAAVDGLSVEYREGNAEALPFADGQFDVALSTFGVMFAPDQERAAQELLRVVRPGGRIGLANWTPGSFQGRQFALLDRYAPEAGDARRPTRWGTRAGLRALFPPALATVVAHRRTIRTRSDTPRAFVEFMRRSFGPAVRVFEALPPDRQEELAREFTELVAAANRSGDATVLVPGEYLEVVVTKR